MQPRADVTRWDELALERVNEMVSRKTVQGTESALTQVYLKKGALVPLHEHAHEQMIYVLQGGLRATVVALPGDEAPTGEDLDVSVREGEVLRIPAFHAHQVEALDDTFVIAVLVSPEEAP